MHNININSLYSILSSLIFTINVNSAILSDIRYLKGDASMKSYSKVTEKIAGLLEHDIESRSEHNHMSVNSNGTTQFDGHKCEAHAAIEKEVERLVEIAKGYGMAVEVIR